METTTTANVPDPENLTSSSSIVVIKTNTQKKEKDFRVYDECTSEPRVVQHYKDMRTFQTVDFYRKMEHKYSFENGTYRRLMTIDQAWAELEHYIVSIVYWHDLLTDENANRIRTYV